MRMEWRAFLNAAATGEVRINARCRRGMTHDVLCWFFSVAALLVLEFTKVPVGGVQKSISTLTYRGRCDQG